LVTVPIILGQAVGYCTSDFGSGCWFLFPLFWIMLLMNVPMILDQAVAYSSHFWISLMVTVPITLDQAVGYSSYYFGSGCQLLFPLFWIRLLITVSHHFGSGFW
jgi:hypothetical protein